MSELPYEPQSDEERWLLAIVDGFARALLEQHHRVPDLTAGFVSGRYKLLVGSSEVVLVTAPHDGPEVLLDDGAGHGS